VEDLMEPFIGQIQLFGFGWAPRGWALCDGSLLSISSNTALFSLLGTTYGGDGRTTFALPDLRGRVPVGQGQGPGLTNRTLGEVGGEEAVTLTVQQIAPHNHGIQASGSAASKSPAGQVPAFTSAGSSYGASDGTQMAPGMATNTGGGQPHDNMPPYLGACYCIALVGIYPSRN
jgi:microcystin-dependent protein